MFGCRLVPAWVGVGCFTVHFRSGYLTVPEIPVEESFGSIRSVYHKQHLAQKSDLQMKGEDNSLLLTQPKLFLGNIFREWKICYHRGAFQVNVENL